MPEILVVFTALGGLIGIAELLHRWAGVRAVHTRRMVHLGTGLAVVSFPYIFEFVAPVYFLAGIFVLINGAALLWNRLPGMHGADRVTWGTVTFPLALLVVLPFTWSTDRVFALQTSFLVLAVCDPLAAWVGERAGRQSMISAGSRVKSITGSAGFFVSALVVTVIAGYVLNTWPPVASTPVLFAVGGMAAMVGTVVEFLGGEGWDNLFIAVSVAVLLTVWQMHPDWWFDLWMGAGFGLAFGLTAWRMQYLTIFGAVAGGLFAATLVGFGGWPWALPGFTFFFLSSILSKVGRAVKTGTDQTLTGRDRRTVGQVYANGGVAWAMITAYALAPAPYFYWAFLGAVSAAAADTWASEIGPLAGRNPRMILSGRPVPARTSGAVSIGGTLGGLAGAAAIWAAAYAGGSQIISAAGPMWSLFVIVLSGTAGSVVDSLAGATVQAIYREPVSGGYVEAPVEGDGRATLVRGWRWIDNQRVNWLCTGSGALSGLLFHALG